MKSAGDTYLIIVATVSCKEPEVEKELKFKKDDRLSPHRDQRVRIKITVNVK